MANINHVALSGNLTADPSLRGENVCSLRLAVSGREKTQDGWQNRPNYFDVTVFGNQAAHVAERFSKGDKIQVEGRLRWREWQTVDGRRRQSVEVVAKTVEAMTASNTANDVEREVVA